MNSLIGKDIVLMRKRYDEALRLQGIPSTYQFPNLPESSLQGDVRIDSYSVPMETFVFVDGNPKIKTIRRYGWVVANSDQLPMLLHCSWNLPHVQKDSIFRFSGQYSELPERVFRVTEITYDLQAADHLVCQIIPAYDEKNLVGRTDTEVRKTYDSSNHFLKPNTDYRGDQYKVKEDVV